MNINYHKKEDALYLRFNNAAIAESDEVREGVILDLDKNDKIVGLEFLDASRRFPRQFASLLAKDKLEFASAL